MADLAAFYSMRDIDPVQPRNVWVRIMSTNSVYSPYSIYFSYISTSLMYTICGHKTLRTVQQALAGSRRFAQGLTIAYITSHSRAQTGNTAFGPLIDEKLGCPLNYCGFDFVTLHRHQLVDADVLVVTSAFKRI